MKHEVKPCEIRILVADDHPDIRNSTVRLLENAGYTVDRADSGAAALTSVREHHPHLVLLDREMPGMDGLEVCRAIRTDPTLTGVFVIFVSGVNVASEEQAEGLESGADGYITRPIANRELLARVEAYVRILSLNRSLQSHVEELQQARRAGLNLMEEAVQVRDQLDAVNQVLQKKIAETKRSEASMVASEMRYRRLFEAAKDGILILNAETGRIVDVNPFLTELLGYVREFFIGKHLWELGFFKDIAANEEKFKELQAMDYIRYKDLPLETSDRRRIYVEFVSNAYLVDGYRVIQCNIRDITERKRANEEITKLSRRHELILNSVIEGIHGIDLQGNITFENAAAAKMFGSEIKEMVGQPAHALMHHSHADGSAYPVEECPIYATLRDGVPRRVTNEVFWRKNGTNFPVEYVCTPKLESTGAIIGAVVMFEDVTERKRIEASHTRLALAVEQSAESIVITDMSANILYVNPAFEKNSGYTHAEVLGKNPHILKSGKHDAAFYRQLWGVLQRGEVWRGHFINQRKNGKLYEEEATISPLRDNKGKVINYVAVKRDVTREVQLEAQFRQAQKMEAIGTLAGGVAHDFNNILAVIQMQAALLNSNGDLSAAQSELAEDIGVAVQRAVALTRQLLMFSRKEVLQPRDLDLNHSINEMTKMLTRLLGENIAVQLKLAAQPMFLHADAGMMDQVLMNLCVNARDAMPDGGRMVIETAGVEFDEFAATQTAQARPGSFVRLSVSDNGCGVPPENLSKIFEPFFTTKGVGKGTGLGLATVFGIAQQHLGWVNVYSEVGHGTTFKVYLPRLMESHDTKINAKRQATAPIGHETVLLVEDEPTLRTMIGKSLSRLGYRVLEAATGKKALEVWKEHPGAILLLLTDLMMPDGMTGKELSQRLGQENPKLKVIYMSGYSADIVAKDFPLQEGVNFLAKPFPVQKLAQAIRQSLDTPAVGT